MEARSALRALWDVDLAFDNVVGTTVTPHLGEIRLAWWRERLEDLDKGVAPPAEPRLQAVAATLIPAGISGSELSRLEDCWLPLLSPYPWGNLEADAISERGAILFGIAARLLGQQAADAEPLGKLWSLAETAERVDDASSRVLLFTRANSVLNALPRKRFAAGLWPLVMIAARRSYDLLHGDCSKLHRVLWAIRFVLTKRIPDS